MSLHSLPNLVAPLLLLSSPLAQQPDPRIASLAPGAVLRLGTPLCSSPSAAVEELHALRFTSRLELDAVALIGTDAILVHHPARFRAFNPLGTGIRALGTLPTGVGTDALLTIDGSGLAVLRGDSVFFARTTFAHLADWNQVERLWVFEEAGRHEVFGLDPSATLLRRATHDPALGGVAVAAAWVEHAPVLCGTLNDLTCMDFSSNAGREVTLLTPTQFAVMSSDFSSLILAGSATPTDQLESLRIATNEYLLDLSKVGANSVLFAGSALAAAPGPYWLQGRQFSGMLVTRLDAGAGEEHHMVLPETSHGFATVLGLSSPTPPASFQTWKSDGRDTISTYEPGTMATSGIRCAVDGDFDLDGDVDLMVAHEGSQELRIWLNQTKSAELERVNCVDPDISLSEPTEGFVEITYPLRKGPFLLDTTEFHVQVWLEANDGTGALPMLLANSHELYPSTDLSYSLAYGAWEYPPTHVVWLSITGIERDANSGAVVRRLPTRNIYYSPSTTTEASLEAAYPVLQYGELGGSGDPGGYRRGPGTGPSNGGNQPQNP